MMNGNGNSGFDHMTNFHVYNQVMKDSNATGHGNVNESSVNSDDFRKAYKTFLKLILALIVIIAVFKVVIFG